jgi:hypothetical protein
LGKLFPANFIKALSFRLSTLQDNGRRRGYFLSLCLAIPALVFLVLMTSRPASEPSDIPAGVSDAVQTTERANDPSGDAGANAVTREWVPPAHQGSLEPRLTGYLVDVMCRKTDVRLLVCLETMGFDALLVEAVTDDPDFASKISDYRTALDAWGTTAKAGETFDAQSYLVCQNGDRITFSGSECPASDGWSSVHPCGKVIQLADIQRADDASSLVIVGQPRSADYNPARLDSRDVVTRLLRNPGNRSAPVWLDARGVADGTPQPGYAWIRVQDSFYPRLLLDVGSVPDAKSLTTRLSSDSPARINVCFRGDFQAVVPVLHCVEFSVPKQPARQAVAASAPAPVKSRTRTSTSSSPDPEQRRASSPPPPAAPKRASGVEERWFILTTGSGQGPEAQRFYGTYAEARKEADKMERKLGANFKVRPE